MRTLSPFFAALACLAPLGAQNVGLQLTNGVDSYIDVPYAPTLVPRSGITFEAWITYDETTLGPGYRWPTLVRQNSTPGLETFMLRVDAGNVNNRNLLWMVRTTNGTRSVIWPFAPTQLANWTHVAGTYDGTNVRLLVNGAEVMSTAATGAIVDAGNTLRLGNGDLSSPGIEQWNGQIDEVRLWPFARTAAEITSTMNYELVAIPGEASNWNLNGNPLDGSGSNHGQLINAPNFAANTLNLQVSALNAANFGSATTGCNGLPRAVQSSLARVNNAAFAVGAIRTTATGSGILWLGTLALTTPINFLGVNFWIDPTAPNVQVSVPGGPLGYARIPLPIPNNRFLANRQLVLQTIWTQPGCAVPLFASDGLAFIIVP